MNTWRAQLKQSQFDAVVAECDSLRATLATQAAEIKKLQDAYHTAMLVPGDPSYVLLEDERNTLKFHCDAQAATIEGLESEVASLKQFMHNHPGEA